MGWPDPVHSGDAGKLKPGLFFQWKACHESQVCTGLYTCWTFASGTAQLPMQPLIADGLVSVSHALLSWGLGLKVACVQPAGNAGPGVKCLSFFGVHRKQHKWPAGRRYCYCVFLVARAVDLFVLVCVWKSLYLSWSIDFRTRNHQPVMVCCLGRGLFGVQWSGVLSNVATGLGSVLFHNNILFMNHEFSIHI